MGALARMPELARAALLIGVLCVGEACAQPRGVEVIARSELVSLTRDRSNGGDVLTLIAEPGVKISALLPPSIDRGELPPIVFDGVGRTADSAYFVRSPTATIAGMKSMRGTLRASACPEGLRVCRSVELELALKSSDVHRPRVP